MAEILYAPDRERVITCNAWAFLHWLKIVHNVALADWSALQRFSVEQPAEFGAAMAAFARLPREALHLARHSGAQEALVVRGGDGSRVSLSRDQLLFGGQSPLPPSAPHQGRDALQELLARLWPPAMLIRPLADLLLYADLRPDDRLLVVGPTWPWLAALLEGTTVIFAPPPASSVLAVAAEERATVLAAPVQILGEVAFQRRHRPDLANLRELIAAGGPLSPEARRRIYAWVKSDVMLLARSGDTVWGNPLEPVVVRPIAAPALLRRPALTPATR
jgi:hypothetical protein